VVVFLSLLTVLCVGFQISVVHSELKQGTVFHSVSIGIIVGRVLGVIATPTRKENWVDVVLERQHQ
jgi:hypothetical protein